MNKAAMTVLVVDDVPDNVAIAGQVLKRLGHRFIEARSGEEAVEKFHTEAPDMILMDVMMPGMGGLEATRRIREAAGACWLPILMVTALSREDEVLEGLRAGADDYLTKPLSLPVFQAKIQVFQRIAELQQALSRHSDELAAYYQQAEEERRLGASLMAYMVNREGLSDPALRYRVTPAWHFSGDLVAAARTPGKAHHILLSDGMGHGLPAAMGSLPQFDTFYAMTELGYGIERIVEVMNERMHTMMPQGRFSALTLVAINPVTGTIEVWNGGNPPPCLIDAGGRVLKCWNSRHLPLGVMPPEEFSAEPEVYFYGGPCQLFLWSDGLSEAENPEGVQFGDERARAALSAAAPAQRFERLLQALDTHRAGAVADDISAIGVDIPTPGAVLEMVVQETGAARGSDHLCMIFHFEALDLKNLDVVPALTGMIERIDALKEHAGQIFIILSELVSNALDHGLLRLDSTLKTGQEGFAAYAARRQKALHALERGFIEIQLDVLRRGGRKTARITVRDSGPGFDWEAQSQISDHALYGRGIALVRRLSHAMHYVGSGNEVVVHYELSPAERAPAPAAPYALLQ